jgi:branched-subunit amino acid aminotransferase/4-amino-4-deoxychorismate lyase
VNGKRLQVNGEAANADDLRWLVANNYGHFTSMRVENGGVRGLDLHLDRLAASTRNLFGTDLDRDVVRGYVRAAIDGLHGPLSVRINVFSRTYDRDNPARAVAADVLVSVSAASLPNETPLSVKSFAYERESPAIKHVGTFPLFHYRRQAQQAGFDDALFVDGAGRVSEGSIWNVGFFEGDSVVWPNARQLEGVSKQLLRGAFASGGIVDRAQAVALADIGRFSGAFFTNSAQSVRPIAHIDGVPFDVDADLVARLRNCYDSVRIDRI